MSPGHMTLGEDVLVMETQLLGTGKEGQVGAGTGKEGQVGTGAGK